jgi:hypothetical protein
MSKVAICWQNLKFVAKSCHLSPKVAIYCWLSTDSLLTLMTSTNSLTDLLLTSTDFYWLLLTLYRFLLTLYRLLQTRFTWPFGFAKCLDNLDQLGTFKAKWLGDGWWVMDGWWMDLSQTTTTPRALLVEQC